MRRRTWCRKGFHLAKGKGVLYEPMQTLPGWISSYLSYKRWEQAKALCLPIFPSMRWLWSDRYSLPGIWSCTRKQNNNHIWPNQECGFLVCHRSRNREVWSALRKLPPSKNTWARQVVEIWTKLISSIPLALPKLLNFESSGVFLLASCYASSFWASRRFVVLITEDTSVESPISEARVDACCMWNCAVAVSPFLR